MYEMFHTRNSLHRRAYQHKTTKIIEYMLTEALIKADPHLMLQGTKGCEGVRVYVCVVCDWVWLMQESTYVQGYP